MNTAATAKNIFSSIDWNSVSIAMHDRGFALVRRVLTRESCDELIENYDKYNVRKTVVMERHRFGLGEYKYFDYPLPDLVQTARTEIYPRLVPIANEWMERSGLDTRFPDTFDEMQKRCRDNGQMKPTPLILKYGK